MSSSPPPTSAPPPSTSPPPPSSTSPPPSNSTSPPPQPLSSPRPPSTPPPPPATAPPPSNPITPSTPSAPPSPSLPLNPSPPSSSTPPNSPSGSSGSGRSPPSSGRSPPARHSSSSSTSTGLVVGLAVGGVVILLLLVVLWICCFRKKRRSGPMPPMQQQYYVAPPSRKDESYEQHQNWHSAAPTAGHVVKIPPKPSPSPPLPFASCPPHGPSNFGVPPSVMSNSGSSGLNHSGSDNSQVPPSPAVSLGLPKSTFTYEELVMATDGFSDANLLGQGGFGYVHRGMLPNGKEVAVKQLKSGSGQGEREFQAEVEIISRVHHRYLVSLVGYCIAEGRRLLVYEFVPNNTLEFHLHGRGRPPLDWPTRLKVALGSAKGLAYLHEDCHPKIIHRDIKSSNILLDFKFEAKVADFGLAKSASEGNTHVSTRVMGTFGYLAPEYASSGKLTDKSDVFSFGVMLLELITGRRPFDSSQSFMDDSLVDWARPLLTRALEDGNFDPLVDPRLGKDYNHGEMRRMIACAAASVRHSAKLRPRMSQIVRALEGDISFEDLNEGVKPGHSSVYGSYTSSDYDAMKYNEDMKKFRKMALASEDFGNSRYSAPTSDYDLGLKQSGSSGESRDTGEMEMSSRMKKESRGS